MRVVRVKYLTQASIMIPHHHRGAGQGPTGLTLKSRFDSSISRVQVKRYKGKNHLPGWRLISALGD